MSWIHEIKVDEAEGELLRIYESIEKSRGKVSNIMKAHSLSPGAMRRHMALYVHLMFGDSNLSRWEREAIAIAVSEENRCNYCIAHHRFALEQTPKYTAGSGGRKHGDRHVYAEAYARKLTAVPDSMTRSDIDSLRVAGFDEQEILEITLIAAYFNFVNRIALGLGVEFSDEEVNGYRVT